MRLILSALALYASFFHSIVARADSSYSHLLQKENSLTANAIDDDKALDELMSGIYTDNYDRTFTAIKAGAPINARFWDNSTPLHVAVQFSTIEIVGLLIANHANVDAQDVDGIVPLYWTVNEPEMTRLLIEGHANPLLQDRSGFAPIHYMASHVESLRHVLESPQVDVNFRTKEGWTALMVASAERPSAESVKILLANGADKSLKNKRGQGALAIAQIFFDSYSKSPIPGREKYVEELKQIISLLQ